MNRLDIIDAGDGQITVEWQLADGARPYASDGHESEFPMETEDRRRLRDYLEKFLKEPWGAAPDIARQVERDMAAWGEDLFGHVFEEDPKAHECYIRAVNDGLKDCLLSVVSSDPAFVGRPWELLRDPDRGWLATHMGGFTRSRVDINPAAEPDLETDCLRILMVTARPGGKQDVDYRMVARPMLAALSQSDVPITVELLRPPTFDEFVRRLGAKPTPHVVHFDGHGYFPVEAQEAAGGFFASDLTGILCFEREEADEHGNWADPVPAERIGEMLRECGVPLFVLNACRSAVGPDEVTDLGSSVAHTLVRTGARAVVAMNFSVYAHTAAKFVARFYAELLSGRSVAGGVAEGREALMADPKRPTIAGTQELQDWIVPVLFQQRDYTPLPEAQVQERTLQEFATEVAEAVEAGGGELGEEVRMDGFPEPGRYGFIGRDGDVLMLERLMRAHDAMLVQGMAGTGKSSLARHFAEWLGQTGGIDAGFFASFEEGGSRERILGQVGRAVMGLDFSRLPLEQQEEVALKILRENRCLLVWDNFESVKGFPNEEFAMCSAEEADGLRKLLGELAGGGSTVLITSRREEEWVGAYGLYELEGLPAPDARELAGKVLAQHGVQAAQVGEDLEELIEELGYHPLVLQAVLPRLRETTARALIEELQEGRLRLPRLKGEGDREHDLRASLELSLQGVSEETRRLLPLLALFTRYVRAEVAAILTHEDSVWSEAHGAADGDAWRAALDELVDVALLKRVGEGTYSILPALPAYLAEKYEDEVPAELRAHVEEAFLHLYAVLGVSVSDAAETNAEMAVAMGTVEEDNLTVAFRRALDEERWTVAQAALQPLSWHLERTGRRAKHERHLERAREATEDRLTDEDAAGLWVFAAGTLSGLLLERGDLDAAEAVRRSILVHLQSENTPKREHREAQVYEVLGVVARDGGRWEEAAEWYHRSLEISAKLGDERGAGATYHHLGVVAGERRRWDEAEQWYRRSLAVDEKLGDEPSAATSCYGLGRVAEERGRWDEAEKWYRRSLEVEEKLGDELGAASSYHQLGMVEQARGRWDDAEQWYHQAVATFERLENERHASATYHQLGMVAQARGRWDEAEQWYLRAVEIRERLDIKAMLARDYHQLGCLALERGRGDKAEQWYRRSLAITERLGDEPSAALTMTGMGLLDIARQNPEAGREWLGKALEVFERYGMQSQTEGMRQYLVELDAPQAEGSEEEPAE